MISVDWIEQYRESSVRWLARIHPERSGCRADIASSRRCEPRKGRELRFAMRRMELIRTVPEEREIGLRHP